MCDPGIKDIDELRHAMRDLGYAANELDNGLMWARTLRGHAYWSKVYTWLQDLAEELEEMIEEYEEEEEERDDEDDDECQGKGKRCST